MTDLENWYYENRSTHEARPIKTTVKRISKKTKLDNLERNRKSIIKTITVFENSIATQRHKLNQVSEEIRKLRAKKFGGCGTEPSSIKCGLSSHNADWEETCHSCGKQRGFKM